MSMCQCVNKWLNVSIRQGHSIIAQMPLYFRSPVTVTLAEYLDLNLYNFARDNCSESFQANHPLYQDMQSKKELQTDLKCNAYVCICPNTDKHQTCHRLCLCACKSCNGNIVISDMPVIPPDDGRRRSTRRKRQHLTPIVEETSTPTRTPAPVGKAAVTSKHVYEKGTVLVVAHHIDDPWFFLLGHDAGVNDLVLNGWYLELSATTNKIGFLYEVGQSHILQVHQHAGVAIMSIHTKQYLILDSDHQKAVKANNNYLENWNVADVTITKPKRSTAELMWTHLKSVRDRDATIKLVLKETYFPLNGDRITVMADIVGLAVEAFLQKYLQVQWDSRGTTAIPECEMPQSAVQLLASANRRDEIEVLKMTSVVSELAGMVHVSLQDFYELTFQPATKSSRKVVEDPSGMVRCCSRHRDHNSRDYNTCTTYVGKHGLWISCPENQCTGLKQSLTEERAEFEKSLLTALNSSDRLPYTVEQDKFHFLVNGRKCSVAELFRTLVECHRRLATALNVLCTALGTERADKLKQDLKIRVLQIACTYSETASNPSLIQLHKLSQDIDVSEDLTASPACIKLVTKVVDACVNSVTDLLTEEPTQLKTVITSPLSSDLVHCFILQNGKKLWLTSDLFTNAHRAYLGNSVEQSSQLTGSNRDDHDEDHDDDHDDEQNGFQQDSPAKGFQQNLSGGKSDGSHGDHNYQNCVGSKSDNNLNVDHNNHRKNLPAKQFQQNHSGGISAGGEHGVNSSHDGNQRDPEKLEQSELLTPPCVAPAIHRADVRAHDIVAKSLVLVFDEHSNLDENEGNCKGLTSPLVASAIDNFAGVDSATSVRFGGLTSRNNATSLHSYFTTEDATVPTFISSLFGDDVTPLMVRLKGECTAAYLPLTAEQLKKANDWHVFTPFVLKNATTHSSWRVVGNEAVLAAERIFTLDSFASFQIAWLLHQLTSRNILRVISSKKLSQLFGTDLLTAGSVNTAAMGVQNQQLTRVHDCLSTRRKILRTGLMTFGCYKSGIKAAPVLVECLNKPKPNRKGKTTFYDALQLAKDCHDSWESESLEGNDAHVDVQWREHCESRGLIVLEQDQQGYGNKEAMYANMASPYSRCTLCNFEFRGLGQAYTHVISQKHCSHVCTCKIAGNECSCAPPKLVVVYDIFNEAVRKANDNIPDSCVGVWDFQDAQISGQVTIPLPWTQHYRFLRRTGRKSVCDCVVKVDTYTHIKESHHPEWLLIENDRKISLQGSVENLWTTVEIFGRLHTFTRTLRSIDCKRDNQFSKREDLQTCWFSCHKCVALFVKLNDKTENSSLLRRDLKLQTFIDNEAKSRLSPYEEQVKVLMCLIESNQSQNFVTGLIHALQYGGELIDGISRAFVDRKHIQHEVQFEIICAILHKMSSPKLQGRKGEIADVLYDVSNALCNFAPTDYNYLARLFGLPQYKSSQKRWTASTSSVRPIEYLGVTSDSLRHVWVRDNESRKVLCVLSYDGGRIRRDLAVVYDDDKTHRHIVGTQMPTDPSLIDWFKSQMEVDSIIGRTTTKTQGDEAGALANWADKVTQQRALAYSAMLMVLNPLQNHESGTPIGSAPLTFRKWYVVLNWIFYWYSMCWSVDPVVELVAVCGDSDNAQLRAHVWLMIPQRQLIKHGFHYAVLGTPLQILYPPIGWGRSRLLLASSDPVHNLMSIITRDLWNSSSRFVVWQKSDGAEVVASGEHVVRLSEQHGYQYDDEIKGIIKSNPYRHKRPNAAWALISATHVQAMYAGGFCPGTAAYLEMASLLFSPWNEESAEQGTRKVLLNMWTGLLAFKAMRAHQIYKSLSMKGYSTKEPKRQMTTSQTTMSLEVMVVTFTVLQVSIARRKDELLASIAQRGANTYSCVEDDHGHLNKGDLADFQSAFRGNEMTSCPVEKGISASQGRDQKNHHSNTHAPTYGANLGGMSNLHRKIEGRQKLMEREGAPNASYNKRERAGAPRLSEKENAVTNEEVLELIKQAAVECRKFIGRLSERLGPGPSGITYVNEFELMGIDMEDPEGMAVEFTKRCLEFHNQSLKGTTFEVKSALTHPKEFDSVPTWSDPSIAVPRKKLRGFRLGISKQEVEEERQQWQTLCKAQNLPSPHVLYDGTQPYSIDNEPNSWVLNDESENEDDDVEHEVDNPETCSSEGHDFLAHADPVFVTNTTIWPVGTKVRLSCNKFSVMEALEHTLTGQSTGTKFQKNIVYDATEVDRGLLRECLYDVYVKDNEIVRARVVVNSRTRKGCEDRRTQDKTKVWKRWESKGAMQSEMVCIEGILASVQLLEYSTISRNRGRKHAYHTYHLESEVPEDVDVINNMFLIYRLPTELLWKVIVVNSILVGSTVLSGISKTQRGEHGKMKGKLLWDEAKFSGTEYVLVQPTKNESANSYLRFRHTNTERSAISAEHFVMPIPCLATDDDSGDVLVRGHVYKFLLQEQSLAPWNPNTVELPDTKRIQPDFQDEDNEEHSRIATKNFRKLVQTSKTKGTVECAPLAEYQIVFLYLCAILLPATQHIVNDNPLLRVAAVIQLLLQNRSVTADVLDRFPRVTNLFEALRRAEGSKAKYLAQQNRLCICREECGNSDPKKLWIIDCDETCGCNGMGRINCLKHKLHFCNKKGPDMIIFVLNMNKNRDLIFEPQLLLLPQDSHHCTSTYALTSMYSEQNELLFLNPRDCLWRRFTNNHIATELRARTQQELERMVAMGFFFGRLNQSTKAGQHNTQNVPGPALVAYTRLDWTSKRGFGGGVLTAIRKLTPDNSFCNIPVMRELKMPACALQLQLNTGNLMLKQGPNDPVSIADAYVRLLAEGSWNDNTIAILGPFTNIEFFGLERVIPGKTNTICVLMGSSTATRFDNLLILDLKNRTAILHAKSSCALAKKLIWHLFSVKLLTRHWAKIIPDRPRNKADELANPHMALDMLMALTTFMLAKRRNDFQIVKIEQKVAVAHMICCVAWQTCKRPPASQQLVSCL